MLLLAAVAAPPKASEVSGDLGGVWSSDMDPVIVTGPSRVPSGGSLLIEPGIRVFFLPGAGIRVNGLLIAQGVVGQPVRFDRTAQGCWDSISVLPGGLAVMGMCVIRGGGESSGQANGMLRVDGGELNLYACDVSGSCTNGVFVTDGRLAAAASRFYDNGGIFPTDAGVHVVYGTVRLGTGPNRNSLTNGTTYGLYNEGLEPVYATDTWWGSPTGPQHSDNIDGVGASVSDDVVFEGFATHTPYPFAGDVNGDGQVSMQDVIAAARIAGGLERSTSGAAGAADVCPDGEVNILDVARLVRVVNGLGAL
jgi:hypothetical protein